MIFQLRIGALAIGRALSFGFRKPCPGRPSSSSSSFLGIGNLLIPRNVSPNPILISGLKDNLCRQFNTLVAKQSSLLDLSRSQTCPLLWQPKRTHTKFSLTKGRQKTVKAVTKRFLRLRWGGWIRPMIGRHKRLWKKNWKQRQRLRRHVFCTTGQNTLFDHMVTRFWKRPKYYVDDPYEPYHVRNDMPYKYYTKFR